MLGLEALRRLVAGAEAWVRGRRWYPDKTARFTVERAWWLDENSRLLGLVLRVRGFRVYVPLKLSEHEPEHLDPHDYIALDLDGVRLYAYEAEYSSEYLARLLSGRLRGLEVSSSVLLDPSAQVTVKPLYAGSTNVLVEAHVAGLHAVLKSYRVVSRSNLEPMFLEYLSTIGYEGAPRLLATARLGGVYVGLCEEYVESAGDGGTPFYANAVSYVKGETSRLPGREIGLLAETISRFHEAMATCRRDWCRPEPVTPVDVERWAGRLRSMLTQLLGRLDSLRASRALGALAPYVDASLIERGVSRAIGGLSVFQGRVKMRIHQDLHLSQMLYRGDEGFTIIDFEGEPARSDEERLLKEPAARDLACVIRSLAYIAFFAAKEALRASVAETAISILEGSETARRALEWYEEALTALVEAYAEACKPRSHIVHGVKPGELHEWLPDAVKPWVVEKALYEALYEARFRPLNLPVPLLGLTGVFKWPPRS